MLIKLTESPYTSSICMLSKFRVPLQSSYGTQALMLASLLQVLVSLCAMPLRVLLFAAAFDNSPYYYYHYTRSS